MEPRGGEIRVLEKSLDSVGGVGSSRRGGVTSQRSGKAGGKVEGSVRGVGGSRNL